MNLLPIVQQSESFQTLAAAAEKNRAAALFGAHPVHRALYAAALQDALSRPVIVVTDTDAEAVRMQNDLAALTSAGTAQFPSRDFVFLNVEGTSHDLETSRLSVLGRMAKGRVAIVVCSLEAYLQYTIPKAEYQALSFAIKIGETLGLKETLAGLLAAGYTRSERVDGRGQFALRGGILDIFPADREQPVRIELFGDEVDMMHAFDPETQRSQKPVKRMTVTPAREVLLGKGDDAVALLQKRLESAKDEQYCKMLTRDIEFLQNDIMPPATDRYLPVCYQQKNTVADYFEDAVLLYSEPAALRARGKTLAEQHWADIEPLVESGILEGGRNDFYASFDPEPKGAVVYADVFARTGVADNLSEMVNINASVIPRFSGEFQPLLEEIRGYLATGFRIAVLAPTERAAENIKNDLVDEGVTAFRPESDDAKIAAGTVAVSVGTLSSGFEISGLRFALFSGAKTAPAKRKEKKAKRRDKNAFGSLEDLRVGDFVVHKNHGIGQYDGIHRIDHHGLVRDYIKIRYRGSDILYLPVTQLDMVTQYIAPRHSENVQLAKLHSGEWQKTKQRIYRSVREMTKELIELYAQREQAEGIAFSEDGEWQREFEGRFIYEETEDQLRAAAEIKKDMEKKAPMDRLLCGDVGVGKTEVALRAAFKCVLDGYQCAVLVPTTILAWQHLNTFLERMEPYPIKVAMLSRFSTAKEIKEAVAGIKNGTVDIAIGTHRLLQKDIQFKKLGLLVVDEEQRFGVAHKEKLKQQFAGVDVLTLSATPIPRTMNMALSGLRDMSVIEDPPEDRYPVQTFVLEYDERMVKDAIERELARGGQVYYLHNRVETIDRAASKLRELIPDAVIDVAHGQMGEDALSDVWKRMHAGEVDVLLCTTIIETGVDVANCNTLIVEDSDRLGLAQLYQIRGRVGRSNRRAFAYFTFRRDSILTEVAAKRLSAIRDFTSFGSGFKIAMRDLQIRGAGGVLSARQSGHMEAVGYDTYIDILNQAIDDEKGIKPKKKRTETLVDITVNAYISEKYIPDNESRIEMYKRIAAIENRADADDVLDELRDRFGEVPESVEGLVAVAVLRVTAGNLEIYEIAEDKNTLLLYTDSIHPDAVTALIESGTRKVMVSPAGKSYVAMEMNAGETPIAALDNALGIMLAAAPANY